MSRRRLSSLLDSCGALEAILRTRSHAGTPWLTVLTYHRIHPDPEGQPFDPGVIDATPDEFDDQVATVSKYFDVIGLEEVFAYLRGASLPANPAIITFDDGYRDCYDQALPILKKHGCKAVFFVATSYCTERRVYWWDKIAFALRNAQNDVIELSYPTRCLFNLKADPKGAHRTLLNLVKSHFGLDVDRFIDELMVAAGVAWSIEIERKHADDLVMTWEQVLELRRAGMEIHSHTRTHRTLQTLRERDLKDELEGARNDLEQILGEQVRGVSYPVGRSVARFPMLRAAVKDAGYEVGFSNTSGVTWHTRRFDPLDMRRISVECHLPPSYFRALLAVPTFAETVA
jgi:peptidoglycan/xylan/chitin deacetylase (PgdA/CDA1 family)